MGMGLIFILFMFSYAKQAGGYKDILENYSKVLLKETTR